MVEEVVVVPVSSRSVGENYTIAHGEPCMK